MAVESQGMSQDTKTIIVILLLIFAYPLGLLLMWFWMKEWPVWVKILISLPVALGVLMFLAIAALVLFKLTFLGGFQNLQNRHMMWQNKDNGGYVQNFQPGGPMMSALPSPSPVSQLPQAEQKQMYQAARDYVKKNSDPNLQFDLDLKKVVDQYAILQVIPLNQQIDPAQVIMQKENGKWVAQTLGTDFPDWQQKVPALFN
jgi:hypothetical protein